MVFSTRSYTILIVPERSAKVRRFKVPAQLLLKIMFAGIACVGVGSFLFVHYLYTVDQAHINTALKEENLQLKARLHIFQDEITRINDTLQRIDKFTTRIQAITQLHDPDRDLTASPASHNPLKNAQVLYASGERIDFEDEVLDSKLALRLMDTSVDNLAVDANREESTVGALHDYLSVQEGFFATTPSIRPIQSKLLTSAFGQRMDPYTDQKVMHKGIDFAADKGDDVYATADGVVVYAGERRADYGKTIVISHGYGIQTLFAHVDDFKVNTGQKVKRGDVIAVVGNTGRSLAAHLHYEVRFNGIPQNPEKFILN